MNCYKRQQLESDLSEARERLQAYLAKERDILAGGVQSYGIGNRSLARYNADLANIRQAIKDLKKEVQDLTALLSGQGSRRAVRIVPQDW